MKKTFLILVLISISILSSCQTEDFMEEIQLEQNSIPEVDEVGIKIEKYMKQKSSGSVQGASCYGDYLFQFQDRNANVYIYNLKYKEHVYTFTMEPIISNHCNNVSFSNVFYEKGDEFPLLYVSGSGSGTYNHAQVYRILRNNNLFTFTKVQEIILPKCSEANNLYWTGIIMDNDNNYMYIYANKNGAQIAKLNIPDFNQPEIILTDEDIIEQFSLNSFTHQQGAVISNGFLYVMDGVPGWGDTNYFRIIDLEKHEDYAIYNVSEMGFNQEFEGLTVYKDMLIAPTNGSGIFSIKLYLK